MKISKVPSPFRAQNQPIFIVIKSRAFLPRRVSWDWFMCGSRNFWQGGGGGGVQARRPENSLDNVVFFGPQLNLQFTEGVQWFYYRETYTFPRTQRGTNVFQGGGGGPTFSRGVQLLISIETHITCDFPGGGVRTPIPPLDPHMGLSKKSCYSALNSKIPCSGRERFSNPVYTHQAT